MFIINRSFLFVKTKVKNIQNYDANNLSVLFLFRSVFTSSVLYIDFIFFYGDLILNHTQHKINRKHKIQSTIKHRFTHKSHYEKNHLPESVPNIIPSSTLYFCNAMNKKNNFLIENQMVPHCS